uniref:Transposase n=1 Tax=Rhabditophanes sp. KR3021 TaxID=114890 RepID=A0AC35TTS6_9BILA
MMEIVNEIDEMPSDPDIQPIAKDFTSGTENDQTVPDMLGRMKKGKLDESPDNITVRRMVIAWFCDTVEFWESVNAFHDSGRKYQRIRTPSRKRIGNSVSKVFERCFDCKTEQASFKWKEKMMCEDSGTTSEPVQVESIGRLSRRFAKIIERCLTANLVDATDLEKGIAFDPVLNLFTYKRIKIK